MALNVWDDPDDAWDNVNDLWDSLLSTASPETIHAIKVFINATSDGTEKAFKRGQVVPPGAINLGWIESPPLNPASNMVVVDTSTVTPDNVETAESTVYYANLLGKLEDIKGNKLLTEQYPAIADEFSTEGDISNLDINTEHIFPYVHVSRFFHVDKAGLVPGTLLHDFNSSNIKVVDGSGNLYADSNGDPLFRIKIISTYQPWTGLNSPTVAAGQDVSAYRVHAFVNTDTTANLYLTYDKVEVAPTGQLIHQEIAHKEILNPQPYYEYRPEETEVADFTNRDKTWYSTKSVELKNKLLGLPATDTDGYEVVVPKKAIPDPRLFELFRWRVVCSFSENFTVGTEVDHPINCGVVVTNNLPTSKIAQIFNIISNQPINTASAVFANPLNVSQSLLAKSSDAYWYVNMDTVTNEQLADFDLLVWSPDTTTFDFTQYLGKMKYFTDVLGHVLLVDTDSYLIPQGLGVSTTAGTSPTTGLPTTIPIPSNNPTPTSTAPLADITTWLPQIFLGILEKPTSFNPPPPPNTGWSSNPTPNTGGYLSYRATDGKVYWKSQFLINGSTVSIGFIANAVSTSLTTTVDDSVYTNADSNWVPPVFAGIAGDFPNPPPPGGSGWSTSPIFTDHLSYKASDNTTYYKALPVATAYATVNPAITFSGNVETMVTDLQSWFPSSYPNISANGGAIGTNVSPVVAGSPASGNYTGLAGALYNMPPANLNLPSTSYAVTPTNLSYYLPITQRNPISDTDNGATYNVGSNIFDASILNGWTINTSEPISTFQTSFGTSGGRVQYLLDVPQGSNVLVSGQLATLTTAAISSPITITTTNYNDVKGIARATTTVKSPITGSATSFTVGEVGTITIKKPILPAGALLSQIAITASTPYSSATNGLGAIISSPINTIGTGSQVFSSNASGTLNQSYVISNGSALDLTQPFNMTYTDANAIIGPVSISTTYTYYITTPSSASVNATAPSAQLPFLSPVPLMIESGHLMVSTLGIPQSICSGIPGSAQLLLNIALYSTANRALETFTDQTYASSFTFSSPWQNSWAINITDFPTVLTDYEKNKYNFFYLPEDSATPINVWQRKLSDLTCEELINSSVSPNLLKYVVGANRSYTLEVSNSQIETPSLLLGQSVPYAWTRAYTPLLTVPPDVDTYAIRETEVKGDYAAGTFINRAYPNAPYLCQTRAYMDVDNVGSVNVNWTASGTATLTYNTQFYTPPASITTTAPVTQNVEIVLNAADHGLPMPNYVESHLPYTGVAVPGSIQTYQDDNYYGPNTSQCWPFFGLTGAYGLPSYAPFGVQSSGAAVSFIQDALNFFHNEGFWQLPAGYLAVTGNFDLRTADAVVTFQLAYRCAASAGNAGGIPGVVDAETFALIGSQVLRSGRTDTAQDWHQFYNWPYSRMQFANVSDGNAGSAWQKRTNAFNGPSYAWDLVSVTFDKLYAVHGVTITPWVEGITNTIRIDGVNAIAANTPTAFGNYNAAGMMLPNLGMRGADNQPIYIPFNPVTADQIMVNIGQDGPAYPGQNTRVFGIRDLVAHATIQQTSLVSTTVVVPGYYTTNKVSVTIPVSSSGTAAVSFARDYTANISPQFVGNGTLSNITWKQINIDNPELTANITPHGLISISVADANNQIKVAGKLTFGPLLPTSSMAAAFPGTVFQPSAYSLSAPVQWMTPEGVVSPMPEVGMISKLDGVKLLCDSQGNPVGMPQMPTAATLQQRHYVNLAVSSYGTDRSIQIGFYDKNLQEFVVDANGLPQITYADYIHRGTNNIYIGVLSAFEVDTKTPLPNSDDSPPIPNAMIMPAYGVETLARSKIGLGKLPDNLSKDSTWAIPVRTGRFSQPMVVPAIQNGAITGYLSKYQGTSITAYYDIPEAEEGSWSSLYGKPNIDILLEEPIIQDLSTIQVRQPSILMKRLPTIYNTLADPVRPIFTIYTKEFLSDSFSPLPWSAIRDYEVDTGTIYLNAPLLSNNPSLVAVSYTSTQNIYSFKEYNGHIINLNPYSNTDDSFANKPIYVYLLPHYVADSNGNVITGSQQARTLRYSFDTKVFDPLDPEFDPTAIQLGIIYISTDFDINELVLIDSRRRGGGAIDTLPDTTLTSVAHDAINYIDVSYGTGMSYQNGCFILVRLPIELKAMFTEEEINTIIRRNLSAGVRFGIEDTEGNEW